MESSKMISLSLLTAILAHWSAPTLASEIPRCAKALEDTVTKKIVATNGHASGQGNFVTTRGWIDIQTALLHKNYETSEVADLATALFQNLTSEDVIIDMGSGDSFLSDILFEAKAGGPFAQRAEKDLPSYSGITKSLRSRPLDFFHSRMQSGRFQLSLGHFFEDLPSESYIPKGKSAKLWIDYFGIHSYTDRPDLALRSFVENASLDATLVIIGDPRIKLPKPLYDLAGYLRNTPGLEVQVFRNVESVILVRFTGEPVVIDTLKWVRTQKLPSLPYVRSFKKTGEQYRVEKY